MPASPIRRLAPLAVAGATDRAYASIGPEHRPAGYPRPRRRCIERLRPLRRRRTSPTDRRKVCPSSSKTIRRIPPPRIGIRLSTTEEIFATTGGSEALLFVLGADRATTGTTSSSSNRSTRTTAASRRLVGVRHRSGHDARTEDGYHLPPRERHRGARSDERTRAILLCCNPNNPTGTVYSEEEIRTRCRHLSTSAASTWSADEVYREFTYDGLRPPLRAVNLDGMDDRTSS